MSTGSYQDFFKALGGLESGDNYSYVSPPGYLGYYQFAEVTLQAAGFYNGDGTDALDFSGSWTPLAASYGVTDKASFLAHPEAQDAAATAWFQKVYADLGTLDLLKYDGQTLNGFTLTPSALLAGAHLVGVWALKDYLTSGGATVPHDGGGESVVDYMSRLSGYDTPFAFPQAAPASIVGGVGDDSISGGSGPNQILGGDGADTIQGGPDADQINGNRGNDVIDGGPGGADTLMGGQNDDRITVHAGDSYLNGNLGADTLSGGTGADTLHGGQGGDVIVGGSGAEQIFGDLGDDTLSGGGGADVFHIGPGGGHDLVLDFNVAEGDRVQVDGGAGASVAQVGSDTVVTLSTGDQITLVGVQKASLGDGWLT
jgi:Ca2+-binding RTX toxin-like protein